MLILLLHEFNAMFIANTHLDPKSWYYFYITLLAMLLLISSYILYYYIILYELDRLLSRFVTFFPIFFFSFLFNRKKKKSKSSQTTISAGSSLQSQTLKASIYLIDGSVFWLFYFISWFMIIIIIFSRQNQ